MDERYDLLEKKLNSEKHSPVRLMRVQAQETRLLVFESFSHAVSPVLHPGWLLAHWDKKYYTHVFLVVTKLNITN